MNLSTIWVFNSNSHALSLTNSCVQFQTVVSSEQLQKQTIIGYRVMTEIIIVVFLLTLRRSIKIFCIKQPSFLYYANMEIY